MGIDVNDIKILVNAGFQYLIKTCHQWVKDHPLVSGVLLFFYLLYIFFPYLFSILFYTFPLVLCIAILLGGPRIKLKEHQETIKKDHHNCDKHNVASSSARRRPYLTSQMSRRTLGKNTNIEISKTEVREESYDNAKPFLSEMSNKLHEDNPTLYGSNNNSGKISSYSSITSENVASSEQTVNSFAGLNSRSDTESQDDEDDDYEQQEARNKVVGWTEDDQRNLMDLGSSEIERNKRLESLITKRKARKQMSMQPIRSHSQYENLMDHVGSIMVTKCFQDVEHQPGSAPSLPTRNPFDIPYDPQEEKPILTGGSFGEEFLDNKIHTELLAEDCKKDGVESEPKEDAGAPSLPSFFTKPRTIEEAAGYTRFRRESVDNIQEIPQEISIEEARNDQISDRQEAIENVHPSVFHSDSYDQAITMASDKTEHHDLENPFARDVVSEGSSIASSIEKEKGEVSGTKDNEDKVQPTRDQMPINKDHDDGESSSSSTENNINAIKNEAFRNSVKKVLTCLVIQRNKGLGLKHSTSDPVFNCSQNITTPTKMEERSYYTNRPHHQTTFSIASDMQVEVSETGSPPSAAMDPGSPTERDSLMYDGDVDRDANSGDEDLWGASPHPMKLGDFSQNAPPMKFKLPGIIEESNNSGDVDNDHDNLLGDNVKDVAEQRPGGGTPSILSPRSTLPNGKMEDITDQKSIDGDITESRSSIISSSEGIVSQMQAKSEHLAEYLANLPPSDSGSNALEDPNTSHVREPSAEDSTIVDKLNPIFDKVEDSRESKGMEESQGSSEHSTLASQMKAPKDEYSTSEPYKQHKDQETHIGDHDHQPRIIEDISKIVEENAVEGGTYSRESRTLEKEVIPDSSSTNQEKISEHLRPEERPSAESRDEVNNTSEIPHEVEVKDEALYNSTIHEGSTSLKEGATIVNNIVYKDINNSKADELSRGSEVELRKPEEANVEPALSTVAVSSRTAEDPKGSLDNHPEN